MPAEVIGNARCPLCGGTARVSLSKSKYPVMTMNCCHAQLFARGDKSDMAVRALLIKPAPETTTPPAAQPVTTVRAETPPPPPKPVRTEWKIGF